MDLAPLVLAIARGVGRVGCSLDRFLCGQRLGKAWSAAGPAADRNIAEL
jgi:hypothetical protein